MPKNWKGDPLGFSNIHSVAKQQKNWRGTLWGKKFPEKSLAVPKKIGRGDPLVSPGMVCYAGKQEKPFWFSSLGQIVHFGAIIFCRTFKNYFGQLVWIERKATIIVAFHFMKPWLKMRILNSLIVPKKVERGPFCFGMVLYFMLQALDVLKIKYWVLEVKVHRAQKVDHSEWNWPKSSLCNNNRAFFLRRKDPTKVFFCVSKLFAWW